MSSDRYYTTVSYQPETGEYYKTVQKIEYNRTTGQIEREVISDSTISEDELNEIINDYLNECTTDNGQGDDQN